jgi:hypothetical protein
MSEQSIRLKTTQVYRQRLFQQQAWCQRLV